MLGQFKGLHLNMAKRKTAHWSLFCDEDLAGFDALTFVEPYIYEDLETGEPAVPDERHCQMFIPEETQRAEVARFAFRAAIWVNKRHTARQVPTPSGDIVAVVIPAKESTVLVGAAYDIRLAVGQEEKEERVRSKLSLVRDAYEAAKREHRISEYTCCCLLTSTDVTFFGVAPGHCKTLRDSRRRNVSLTLCRNTRSPQCFRLGL